jgi:hypothetical protein
LPGFSTRAAPEFNLSLTMQNPDSDTIFGAACGIGPPDALFAIQAAQLNRLLVAQPNRLSGE